MTFACLMYHSLSDGWFPDCQYPKYTTTRAQFAEHLRVLLHEGFRVGTFADLLRHLDNGSAPPEHYCVLTFDDGHKSSLDLSETMMNAGVRGTFFLTMNYCRDRADFLKPHEIRQLAKQGFDFGTHGVTHRALSRMRVDEMRAELRDSKAWLESILGATVTSMSLPGGERNDRVFQTATELSYQLVGTSVERINSIRILPARVNRFVVLSSYSSRLVLRIASGSPTHVWKRRLRSAALALPHRLLGSHDVTRA